jgi:hypothetical protein
VHPRFAYVVPASHAERPIGGAEDDAHDLAYFAQEICALHHPDRHRSEDESRANARLCAAAPTLLEALEASHDIVQMYGSPETFAQVTAAINAAKGDA